MTKNDILAQQRSAFVSRYRARLSDFDFEMDLDRLLYAAFAAAQEPFVRELQAYRDNALAGAQLGAQLIPGDFPGLVSRPKS